MESLWDVVDRFVIVEADKTHANIPKPFNFYEHLHDFEKYLPKIHYVMDTSVVEYKGEILDAAALATTPLDDGAELNAYRIVSGG